MRFPPLRTSGRRHTRGVALIIVLSFVVLLTGLILAFFSRSLSERQISNSSAGQVKTDLFSQGAIATIVDDLKQEIAAGSNATYYVDANGNPLGSVYVPAYPVAAVPALALKGSTPPPAVTSFAANLLKRSVYGQNFFPAGGDANADKYSNGNTAATVTVAPGATPSQATAPVRLPSNRAANLSTTDASQNGRAISTARWNKPMLLPKDTANLADPTKLDPSTKAFAAPDWILVARDGSNPGNPTNQNPSFDRTNAKAVNNSSPSNGSYVTGRYAYTIYDEGGLLDANVAGYPTASQPAPYGAYPSGGTTSLPPVPIAKTMLAYADLTIPIPTDATAPTNGITQPLLTAAQVNALVGWRNYASSQPSGSFPAYTAQSTPGAGHPFDLAILNNKNGFLGIGTNSDYYKVVNNQSDRMFGTRQELINLFTQGLPAGPKDTATIAALQNSLQYFGTFSRGLNQPSYAPVSRVATATNQNPRPLIQPSEPKGVLPGGGNNVGDNYQAGADQDIFSPSLLSVRVQASNPQWLRADGTVSVVGEPLIKSRFALQRLAWIYYKGPSADNLGESNVTALTAEYGIDKALLQKGTGGDTGNIQKYFGLTWNAPGHYWRYTGHNRDGTIGPICKLSYPADVKDVVRANREPDFFEILKASVDAGALGKAGTRAKQSQPGEPDPGTHFQPLNFRFIQDISVDAAIIQLGANIIDQFDLDGYPTRIVFNDGSGDREFRGVENLPYIYRLRTGSIKVRESNPPSERQPTGSTAVITPYLHSGTQPGYPSTTPLQQVIPLKDTGVGIIMTIPDVWNPHDQNSSLGRAGSLISTIRLVANSAMPETIYATGGTGTAGFSNFLSGGYVKTEAPYGRSRFTSFTNAVPPDPNANPPIPYFTRGVNLDGKQSSPALIMSGSNGGFNYAHPLSPGTTNYLTFKVLANNSLYHEPTMLGQTDVSNANGTGLSMVIAPNYLDIINLQGDGGARAYSSAAPLYGIKSLNGNPLGVPGAVAGTQGFIGLILGTYPLRWVGPRWTDTPPGNSAAAGTLWNYSDAGLSDGGNPVSAITYSLQYQDPAGGGNWITYDEKYVDSDVSFVKSFESQLLQPGGGNYVFVDPRTPRFGSPTENNIGGDAYNRAPLIGTPPASWASTWLDTTNKMLSVVTEKPDATSGFGSNFRGTTYGDWGSYSSLGLHIQGINTAGGAGNIFWQTGLFAQNDPTFDSDGLRFSTDAAPGVNRRDPNFWSGADGVVRRAMGAYVTTGNTVGQPLATATSFGGTITPKPQSQSRPIVLNRPFRSVGELGYVYSGNPWMNIDFSTPESAYSELLDVFCINENAPLDGLVAGVVNLNTRQPMVLKSVLTGAYVDEQNTSATPIRGGTPVKPLVAADADIIANLLKTRTAGILPAGGDQQPLQNVGDLVGRWNKKQTITRTYNTALDGVHNIDGKQSYAGLSGDLSTLPTGSTWAGAPTGLSADLVKIPRLRESAVRSLSTVGNTRVWNLMIDVIAQNGRFPTGATNIKNFVVEGEQRCWVHLAIDRYSGAILDTKLEIVKE